MMKEIIRSADELIDIGPDAGRLGGEVVFQGRMDAINEAQGDPGKCQELLVRYPRVTR
jgi:excinuclease ABC subunit A